MTHAGFGVKINFFTKFHGRPYVASLHNPLHFPSFVQNEGRPYLNQSRAVSCECSKWNQNSRKVKRGNFNLATIISLKTLVLPEAYFALHKPSFSKSRPFLVVNNSDLDTWLSLSFCSFCAINSVRMIFKWSYAFFSFFAESSFDSVSWHN